MYDKQSIEVKIWSSPCLLHVHSIYTLVHTKLKSLVSLYNDYIDYYVVSTN